MADRALLKRYNRIKKEGNDRLSIVFQWSKQGIIGNTRQFKMLIGDIVEGEINKIAEDMNEEAQSGNTEDRGSIKQSRYTT